MVSNIACGSSEVGNSLMGCAVHNLAGPTPTTFTAATDTLSYIDEGFEGGSNV